jgi:hypothetical protein
MLSVATFAGVLFGALTLWFILDAFFRAARGRSQLRARGLLAVTLSSLLTAAFTIWELLSTLDQVRW